MTLHTHTPEPITVRVVDWGQEYIPGSPANGADVSYLHAEQTGTVICIRGNQWGYDLSVTALCWRGHIPRREDVDITWMCKERRKGHRRIVAWWCDELAGLHRERVQA